MLARHLPQVLLVRSNQLSASIRRRHRRASTRRPAVRSRLVVEPLEPRLLLAWNPSGLEQEMLQLVNRFRTDPQGELTRLVDRLNPISSPERYILQELQYWGVSGNALADQWQDLTPVPPLAWSESLNQSAHAHNAAMIQHDDQQHQFAGEEEPGQRIRDEGYEWRRWGENIYAYPRSNLEAHGGFVIDWGAGPNGIQDPPDHRIRLLNASFQHIGIAVANIGDDPARNVGPLVVTEDLGQPLVAGDAYVVGAIFKQTGSSPWYHSGDGYGTVTITFEGTGGTFRTTSMSAGGFQLQLPPGTYRGIATGGALPMTLVSDEFVIGRANVAVDFAYPRDAAVSPVAQGDIVATDLATGIVLDVLANDEASGAYIDPASVTIQVPPANGSLATWQADQGTFFYEPTGSFRGIDQFQYRVMDSNGMQSNVATVRILIFDYHDHPWHNPWSPLDVNGDDIVSPFDALLVIDDLNTAGSRFLPVPPADVAVPPLLDTSGDDAVTPRDALLVISQLNVGASGEAGEGEQRMSQTRSPESFSSLPALDDAAAIAAVAGESIPSLASTIPSATRPQVSMSAPSEPWSNYLPIGVEEDTLKTERTLRSRPGGDTESAAILRDLLFAEWPLVPARRRQ